jgi:hypothetical protein
VGSRLRDEWNRSAPAVPVGPPEFKSAGRAPRLSLIAGSALAVSESESAAGPEFKSQWHSLLWQCGCYLLLSDNADSEAALIMNIMISIMHGLSH